MVDARTHMLREAAKLERAGAEHGWQVITKDESDGRGGVETVVVVTCVATRGQEVISIWWENKHLLEAPLYKLAGREIKLRNASACVQQMAKKPDFEKAARAAKSAKRRGLDAEDVTADPESLPWVYLGSDATDAEILRSCYAKTIVWKNSITEEVETDVIVRSSDASLRKGNFNSTNYHITVSSKGRRILNFLGALAYRSVALDDVLRIGTNEEAAERVRAEMIKLAAAADKDKEKVVKKAVKRIDG